LRNRAAAGLNPCSIAGIGASTALAVVLLVLVAFASGLIARTNAGKRITQWSEDSFLGRMPQYQLMKSMAEGPAQIENAGDLRPVLGTGHDRREAHGCRIGRNW
jgi:hypothetical protein